MKHVWLTLMLIAPAAAAHADSYQDKMVTYANAHILPWLNTPELVLAIRNQNLRTKGYSQEQIDAADLKWRQEIGLSDQPLIKPVITSGPAEFLRQQIAASDGVMTEAFLMDNVGLNVAVSHVTSDYWQGDEAKFTETVGQGAGKLHVGDIELDESTQTYQGQVSATITDPETGVVIGAITVGLNAERLF